MLIMQDEEFETAVKATFPKVEFNFEHGICHQAKSTNFTVLVEAITFKPQFSWMVLGNTVNGQGTSLEEAQADWKKCYDNFVDSLFESA